MKKSAFMKAVLVLLALTLLPLVAASLGSTVLDPTSVAFKIAEAIADLGLRHSKVARYAKPPVKEIK